MPLIEISDCLYEDAQKEVKKQGLSTLSEAIERRYFGYTEARNTIMHMTKRLESLVENEKILQAKLLRGGNNE